jgi:hypothetical protein
VADYRTVVSDWNDRASLKMEIASEAYEVSRHAFRAKHYAAR